MNFSLYKEADVLFLDEATSALDTISEMGITVDEYTNEAGTMTKLVWADGYEEIFENA